MIYLVSARTYPEDPEYQQKSLSDFHNWVTPLSVYQLDIETNVVDDITEREIYVVQFGLEDGSEKWVLDVASFPPEAIEYVKSVLSNKEQEKLIHNALFEYSVIKQCWGVEIDKIFDTFLMMKVVLNGKNLPDQKLFRLANAVGSYLGIPMSKEEQTSFTGEPLTKAQILYAAEDVAHLGQLRAYFQCLEEYQYHDPIIRLENTVVRAFGDIVVNGFVFNKEKWAENIEWVRPQAEEALSRVYKYMQEELYEQCVALGFIQKDDAITVKWTSPKQKKEILTELYPDLVDVKLPTLKKFEQTIEEDENVVDYLINKEYEKASEFMLKNHRDVLIKLGYFIEKGKILINMDSPQQRLKLFQVVEPGLQSTGADVIKNIKNPLIRAYSDYVGKYKLMTSYGENWFEYVSKDGKIRPRFVDQVLDTGRVSMKKPGMMTLPADEGDYLGDKYREPFEATPGWKIMAADYSSQELCVIAYLAQEDVWLDALKNGKDLHSICASLVFKDKWTAAGGSTDGTKPKTVEAKKLRAFTKTISFGLAYGGGPGMLSNRLDIPMNEAKQLIEDYFSAFPKLREYFNKRARFAVQHGYIDTAPPFRRRRYFPDWSTSFVEPKALSSIERQGKNTSIQGTGADGSKVAMILIKDYIEKNNLQDRVRFLFMLHDAIVMEVRDDFVEEFAPIFKELMIQGHCYNIPGRLIGADVSVTETWTK